MKNALVLSAALGITCTVAAILLAVANAKTYAARAEAKVAEREEALRLVLPEFDNSPSADTCKVELKPEGETVEFFRARRGGKLVGLAARAGAKGYGGRVEVLAGCAPDGKIVKLIVLAHSETPGLGTQVTDRTAQKTLGDLLRGRKDADAEAATLPPSAYLDQYEKFSLSDTPEFKVARDGGKVDAVTGATISSRAVARAMTLVAKAFQEQRAQITQ